MGLADRDDAELRGYYAARALEYDRVYLKPERQSDLRLIEAWLPQALAGRTVLELACGTGYWSVLIREHCARLVSLDANEETLAIARARPRGESIEWLQGDAYQLPHLGREFNGAFAGFWWSHVPLDRQQSFLQGWHAALVPGAVVVLLDNRFVAGSSTPISERDAQGNTYQHRALANGSTHRVLKNFPTERQLRMALEPWADEVEVVEWVHYWAVRYRLRA